MPISRSALGAAVLETGIWWWVNFNNPVAQDLENLLANRLSDKHSNHAKDYDDAEGTSAA